MHPAGEQEVIRTKVGQIDPAGHGLAGWIGEFKLNRSSGLLLDHVRPCRRSISVGHIADPELDQIASPKLAVDSEIEEREVASTAGQLEPSTDCPNFLELERPLLPHEFVLVPRGPRC